jgi:hypothetical protein
MKRRDLVAVLLGSAASVAERRALAEASTSGGASPSYPPLVDSSIAPRLPPTVSTPIPFARALRRLASSLVLNLRTARRLGLAVSPSFLSSVDEVIE